MKEIVGTIRIYKPATKQGLRVYLCNGLKALLGKEIIFNLEKLTLKKPNIDSRITSSAKNNVFTCTPKNGNPEDYVGLYNVFQKDEDTFKLKRCLKTT
jgi:hypothetical protein